VQGRWSLVAGILFSSILLGILFRTVHLSEVEQTLATIEPWYILAAVVSFALAIALRSLRWGILLASIRPVRYQRVAFVLVVGYAVNNLLPARLGEVFRAGLAKSEFQIGGSAALGTIAVERTMDGLVFVTLLAAGLFSLPAGARYHDLIVTVLRIGSTLFLAAAGILYLLSRAHIGWVAGVWRLGADKIEQFRRGLGAIRSRAVVAASLLSLVIGAADICAIWFVLTSLGVVLAPLQMALVTGIVSLSTLVPTAPGYLGTLQFAYVIGVTSFGFSEVQGLVAATACQVFLLTPLTLGGVLLMLTSQIRLASASEAASPARTGQQPVTPARCSDRSLTSLPRAPP